MKKTIIIKHNNKQNKITKDCSLHIDIIEELFSKINCIRSAQGKDWISIDYLCDSVIDKF